MTGSVSALSRAARMRAASNAPMDASLAEAGVWLVIPCYKVRGQILRVLESTPRWVEGIVCVDDACPDRTAELLETRMADEPRLVVLRLPENQGVGGAVMAGYTEAARRGGRILVKVDGDDQMDLSYLPQLVAPILLGEADYTKGNRFTSFSDLAQMPGLRTFGNAVLSFAAKASTGYWNLFDPTNGFTAIEGSVAAQVAKRRVTKRYFFETDLLYHLGALRAVVRDVPMPSRYGDEVSNLRIGQVAVSFAIKHLENFSRRILGQYFVRDFNIATIEMTFGAAFLLFGSLYGLNWLTVRDPGQVASAGVVMTAALPIIVGVQFLLQSMNFDVINVPTRPIHPYLRTLERIASE